MDLLRSLAKHAAQREGPRGPLRRTRGDWSPTRLIVLEFPSLARAREWFDSPEYRPLIALRQRSARTRIVIAEGV